MQLTVDTSDSLASTIVDASNRGPPVLLYTKARTLLVRFIVDLRQSSSCTVCRQQIKSVELEPHRAHVLTSDMHTQTYIHTYIQSYIAPISWKWIRGDSCQSVEQNAFNIHWSLLPGDDTQHPALWASWYRQLRMRQRCAVRQHQQIYLSSSYIGSTREPFKISCTSFLRSDLPLRFIRR